MSDLQWVPRNPRLCFAMSAAMSLRTRTKVCGRGKNSGNPVCRFCHIYLGLKTTSIPVFAVTQRQEFKGVKLSELLSEFGIRLNESDSKSKRSCEKCARQIGLITVSDAILTGRQSGQKLQCLYGNPMAKNFFQNRILRNL